MFYVQPEDGHYQAPKHVVVPYVENTLYSTNKYSRVRRVHTHYISYFIEHNGDDEPRDDQCIFNDSVSIVPTVDDPVGEEAQTETRQVVCCDLRSLGKCLSSTNVMY